MTAREKAAELFDKMYYYQSSNAKLNTPTLVIELSKECALIAVNEILGYMGADRGTEFWQEVKIEIEKL